MDNTTINTDSFKFEVSSNLKKGNHSTNLDNMEGVFKQILGDSLKIEDFSHKTNTDKVYFRNNKSTSSFFESVFFAYQNHYDLKLSVSHFLAAVGQGLATHITQNSKKLRKFFVNHEDQKELKIFRDHFVMGGNNDWTSTFEEFCGLVKDNTNADVNSIIIDDTSVATTASRVVTQISLMDAMKDYFKYTCVTRCGIPNITLVGKSEDWENFQQKIGKLNKLNENDRLQLDWWLKHLTPIIDTICETGIKRTADQKFWKNFLKIEEGSGGPYNSGWINVFFPYLFENKTNIKKNPFVDWQPTKKRFSNGLKDNQVFQGISKVPLTWDYLETLIPMNIFGGFIATKLDEKEGSVEPEFGWLISFANNK